MKDWPTWMKDQFIGALLLFLVVNAVYGLVCLVIFCCTR